MFIFDTLTALQTELGQLCMNESLALTHQPLYDAIQVSIAYFQVDTKLKLSNQQNVSWIQGIIGWIGDNKNNLQKREFEHFSS